MKNENGTAQTLNLGLNSRYHYLDLALHSSSRLHLLETACDWWYPCQCQWRKLL